MHTTLTSTKQHMRAIMYLFGYARMCSFAFPYMHALSFFSHNRKHDQTSMMHTLWLSLAHSFSVYTLALKRTRARKTLQGAHEKLSEEMHIWPSLTRSAMHFFLSFFFSGIDNPTNNVGPGIDNPTNNVGPNRLSQRLDCCLRTYDSGLASEFREIMLFIGKPMEDQ